MLYVISDNCLSSKNTCTLPENEYVALARLVVSSISRLADAYKILVAENQRRKTC